MELRQVHDLRLQSTSNITGILLLLIRHLALIIKVLGAESFELLAGVLLGFVADVGVGEGAARVLISCACFNGPSVAATQFGSLSELGDE